MYDVIVLGVGGVGSACCAQLAQRGLKVLGVERFAPAHDRGSSHGETRAIRQAYFEHPDYVPLLRRAYEQWAELERESGETLYEETGIVQFGPPDGVVMRGVQQAAAEHQLPIEEMTAAEAMRRWPGFAVSEQFMALFEQCAGFLHVERCVQQMIMRAEQHGAVLHFDEEALSWEVDADGVRVTTAAATYHASRLIITAGAWAGQLLADLRAQLSVQRQAMFWYDAPALYYDRASDFPTFLFETAQGYFYGFPQLNERGMKVAQHGTGSELLNPLYVDRSQHQHERVAIEAFLQQYLPHVSREQTGHAVCMYTMSPDGHFIIDRHPEHTQVVFAAGLSGHGFKFAPVLGELLARLVCGDSPDFSIDFLHLSRFSAV